MKLSKPTYRQFSLNDTSLAAVDAEAWANGLSLALSAYANTTVKDEDNREVKAVACATLAGLGLALHQHFGTAVEALGCAEHQSCIAAGLRVVDGGKAHTDKMEQQALKLLS